MGDIYLKLEFQELLIPILASVGIHQLPQASVRIRGLPLDTILEFIPDSDETCALSKSSDAPYNYLTTRRVARGSGGWLGADQSSRVDIYLDFTFPCLHIRFIASVCFLQLPWGSVGNQLPYIVGTHTTAYLGGDMFQSSRADIYLQLDTQCFLPQF